MDESLRSSLSSEKKTLLLVNHVRSFGSMSECDRSFLPRRECTDIQWRNTTITTSSTVHRGVLTPLTVDKAYSRFVSVNKNWGKIYVGPRLKEFCLEGHPPHTYFRPHGYLILVPRSTHPTTHQSHASKIASSIRFENNRKLFFAEVLTSG